MLSFEDRLTKDMFELNKSLEDLEMNELSKPKSSKGSRTPKKRDRQTSPDKEYVKREKVEKKTGKRTRVTSIPMDKPNGLTYIEEFLSEDSASQILEELIKKVEWETPVWQKRELKLSRLIYLFSDEDIIDSFSDRRVSLWPKSVKKIRDQINKTYAREHGVKVKYCDVTYFNDEKSYIGAHRDRDCKKGEYTFTVTLGYPREIKFSQYGKEKGPGVYKFIPVNGSLYIMNHETACRDYKHSIEKLSPKEVWIGPVIYLSFRC